jgi:hypothetical protein
MPSDFLVHLPVNAGWREMNTSGLFQVKLTESQYGLRPFLDRRIQKVGAVVASNLRPWVSLCLK